MADYSSQIATAARLIRQKGMLVQHCRASFGGTYDPVTDSYTETETLTEVWAVRTEAGEPEQKNYGFAIGSAVLYVAADVLDGILVSDSFVIGSERWAIQKVATTAPAGRAVLYAVELKEQGTYTARTVPSSDETQGEGQSDVPQEGQQTEPEGEGV